MAWKYTTIRHEPRIQLGLSNDEYALLDLIHRRANSPGPVQGWCVTSKDVICVDLDYSKSTVKRMLKKMIDLGYLEKSKDGKRKRTTPEFYNVAYSEELQKGGQSEPKERKSGGQSEPLEGVNLNLTGGQSEPQKGVKMDPSNIVSNISKVISNISEQSSPKEKPILFAKIILEYLSAKTGKKFRIPTDDYAFRSSAKFSLVNARFRQGYTAEDFIKVIDVKCNQWMEDLKMAQYLRPSTLFAAKNFEKYLDDWESKSSESESEPPDSHQLPPELQTKYGTSRKNFQSKEVAKRISYFTKAEYQSWMKGGKNFEKWRDRGLLESEIYKKIGETIQTLNTSSFFRQSQGCLADFIESTFQGNIKSL